MKSAGSTFWSVLACRGCPGCEVVGCLGEALAVPLRAGAILFSVSGQWTSCCTALGRDTIEWMIEGKTER